MMVRHDEEMFKVHPEHDCKWGGAGDPPPNRQYWVGDPPSLPDDVTVPRRHPDTNSGVGFVFHTPSMNMSLDAKLDKIIDLLNDIKRMLR